MRLADSRWLTDENIGSDVVTHLRARGLDILDVREQGWYGWSDEKLLKEAHREGRIVHAGVARASSGCRHRPDSAGSHTG